MPTGDLGDRGHRKDHPGLVVDVHHRNQRPALGDQGLQVVEVRGPVGPGSAHGDRPFEWQLGEIVDRAVLQFADHQSLAPILPMPQRAEQSQGVGFGRAGGEDHLRAAEVPGEAGTSLLQDIPGRGA